MALKTIYHCDFLTGGTNSTYLDYIDGNSLSDGDRAFVIVAATGVLYVYRLNATSGAAESSPTIISPDTNAGTKRWILIAIYADLTSLGSIIPITDLTYDLGDATHRWANIYTGDLHLKNDIGDWKVIEGESDLFLINNKNGKKYRMMMQEMIGGN